MRLPNSCGEVAGHLPRAMPAGSNKCPTDAELLPRLRGFWLKLAMNSPTLAEVGQFLADINQFWPNSANWGHFLPISVEIWPKWPNSAKLRPKLANLRPGRRRTARSEVPVAGPSLVAEPRVWSAKQPVESRAPPTGPVPDAEAVNRDLPAAVARRLQAASRRVVFLGSWARTAIGGLGSFLRQALL